jgi:hypothetical protein
MPAEPHRLPAPIAPCDDCRHRSRCGASGETCLSFEGYLTGRTSWRSQPRTPSKRLTGRVRKQEAAAAIEEAAEVLRLEKRLYKRLWARAHPDSGRASRKAWEASHVEQRRAATRKWHHVHHEQSLAIARAWKTAHRAELLERRRTLSAQRREQLNAQRRARYPKDRARILELGRLWRARNAEGVNARQRERRASLVERSHAATAPPPRVYYRGDVAGELRT